MVRRVRVEVQGVVQGVGFRPFVYGLANRLGLVGHVFNDAAGVSIEVEGEDSSIEAFVHALRDSPPPMARVQALRSVDMDPVGETRFSIVESTTRGTARVVVSPDLAVCHDCVAELQDRENRRHRHAFINCTNCGPRYTIIESVPYDRARTTMAEFDMCPQCGAEYADPGNRRFHAEATCCPECGPRLDITDPHGRSIACDDPMREAVRRLEAGQILAIKGIGGFHLACDASNKRAVQELRRRKRRDLKPFAVMTVSLAEAMRVGVIAAETGRLLESPERPIVLVRKHPRLGEGLAEEVAPRNARIGIMLPYTPIHHMLFADSTLRVLVMTSGNASDEPIAHENDDAYKRLGELADAFLIHDRRIRTRTDDSVMQVAAGSFRYLRRSRGHAPFPVTLNRDTSAHEILAVGAELNGAACLTRAGQAYISHHLGDLDHLAAWEAFHQAVETLCRMLDVIPAAVACDLHPAYATTRHARGLSLPVVAVQHHHAHIASVLAETGRDGPVIGVSFDGYGWGDDGNAWGGEFLVCDLADYRRVGCIAPVPLPGGDAAAKRPARTGYVMLREAFGAEEAERLAVRLLPGLAAEERRVIDDMIKKGVNCPSSTSAGRLFDAAAALCGLCDANLYHAQAPMELEGAAWTQENEHGYYAAELSERGGLIHLPGAEIIRGIVNDRLTGVPAAVCAARFHNSLARAAVETCIAIRNNTGLSTVALSGGVFANAWLLEQMNGMLEERGFEVLTNTVVPPGDGGISLGQAAVAARRLSCA
jgi:hydrogenase maturation protein HypF